MIFDCGSTCQKRNVNIKCIDKDKWISFNSLLYWQQNHFKLKKDFYLFGKCCGRKKNDYFCHEITKLM